MLYYFSVILTLVSLYIVHVSRAAALREVCAHAVLGSHSHLVRYYSAWAEDNHMIIQNEFCSGECVRACGCGCGCVMSLPLQEVICCPLYLGIEVRVQSLPRES